MTFKAINKEASARAYRLQTSTHAFDALLRVSAPNTPEITSRHDDLSQDTEMQIDNQPLPTGAGPFVEEESTAYRREGNFAHESVRDNEPMAIDNDSPVVLPTDNNNSSEMDDDQWDFDFGDYDDDRDSVDIALSEFEDAQEDQPLETVAQPLPTVAQPSTPSPYRDPWTKEPPVDTSIPIRQTVYPAVEHDAIAKRSYELYYWVQKNNINRAAHESLIQMINAWIPGKQNDSMYTKTHNLLRNILEQQLFSPSVTENTMATLLGVQEDKYRVCPKNCRLFPKSNTDPCSCGTDQFKDTQNTKPIKTMTYFPLARQIACIAAVKDNFLSLQRTAAKHASANRPMMDIFDGSVIQEKLKHLFPANPQPKVLPTGERLPHLDLAVSLFIDGFTKYGSRSRMTIVHLVLLSLPPKER